MANGHEWMVDAGQENGGAFKEFLQKKGVEADDPRVPLLKEFWNKALDLCEKRMVDIEGVSFGIELFKV